MQTDQSSAFNPSKNKSVLLSFEEISLEGNGYPTKGTLEVWKSTNRHGFRNIVIMVGGRPRVRRSDWESWLESRKLCHAA